MTKKKVQKVIKDIKGTKVQKLKTVQQVLYVTR